MARKALYFINKWKWGVSFCEIFCKLWWQVLSRFNSLLDRMSSPWASVKLHKIHRSLNWYNRVWYISAKGSRNRAVFDKLNSVEVSWWLFSSAERHPVRSVSLEFRFFSDTTVSSVVLSSDAAKLKRVSSGDFCASLKCNFVRYLLPQTSRRVPDQKFATAKFSGQNRKKKPR